MYVLNADELKNTFKCYYPLGDWLHDNFDLPYLRKDDDCYWFGKTQELQNLLDIEPLYIKVAEWAYRKLKGG